MKAIVWSKDACPFCVQAKALLESRGIEFEERNIMAGTWTKEQLLEAVPNARTVPQIFLDEVSAAQKAERVSHFVVSDWYAFMLSFKGVLLEGLEVVFIVVTFGAIQKGSNPQAFSLAIWAAVFAVACRRKLPSRWLA